MERRGVRILILLAVLVLLLTAIGSIGFSILEKLSFPEALAATINILSTVGLGEAPSHSRAGWALIGFLQIGSVLIVAVAVANLSQVLVRGEIRQYLGRKRMDDRIKQLKDHSIITGYSLTGAALAKDLIAEDEPFVIIERDPNLITNLDEMGLLFIEGDATSEHVLKQAGIERARALFAVLSQDSDNLMVVLSARGLNEDLKIVTKSTREELSKRFLRAGADTAISPQEWASRRMTAAVFRPHLLQLLSSLLDPAVKHAYLDEIRVPDGSGVISKSLADSQIRSASGIVILGIARENGEFVSSPDPEIVVQKGDVLIGYGQRNNFASLAKYLRDA